MTLDSPTTDDVARRPGGLTLLGSAQPVCDGDSCVIPEASVELGAATTIESDAETIVDGNVDR